MKSAKNFIKLFFLFILTILLKPSAFADINPFGIDVPIESDAVYLANLDTNTVIFEKNKDLKVPCSALAKIMTTILVLESQECKKNPKKFLNEKITASSQIFDRLYLKGASTANLKKGETITVEAALYATMLASASDTTMMLVEKLCKENTKAFVDMMNDKAEKLGMTNTNFTDPDGLDIVNQYTTAYDMYLLTTYCLKNPLFKKIATTPTYEIPPTNIHNSPTKIIHTNKMLNRYLGGKNYDERVKGIKTGRIQDKENLVSIAHAKSYNYMLITLGCPKVNKETVIFKETKSLYDWVFKNLKLDIIATPFENTIPNNVKINMSRNNQGVLLTPKNQTPILLPSNIDKSTIYLDTSTLPKQLNAPIKKGTSIGKVILKLSDQPIGEMEVVASKDVPVDILSFVVHFVVKTVTSWWFITIATLSSILIGYIIFSNKLKPNRKRKKKLQKYKPLK